jgi:plastocyanin
MIRGRYASKKGVSMSRSAATVGSLLCILGLAGQASAGSVTGKITFDGKVPTFTPLDMNADPVCKSKNASPVMPEVLVLGDQSRLANVLVSIATAFPGKTFPAPKEPAVIEQHGCVYRPHVVGMMAGQELLFRNSDGVLHNVHALPVSNRPFNIGMPPTLKEKGKVVDVPEAAFRVKCDVHPWMQAYVAVYSNPYFAVTGNDGTFQIKDLPAGTYEIEAWHEKLGTRKGSVTVGEGDTKTLDFTFGVPKTP